MSHAELLNETNTDTEDLGEITYALNKVSSVLQMFYNYCKFCKQIFKHNLYILGPTLRADSVVK